MRLSKKVEAIEMIRREEKEKKRYIHVKMFVLKTSIIDQTRSEL